MQSVIITCAPAITGALVTLTLVEDRWPRLSGWPFIASGIGGLLGFVSLGIAMSFADYLGISVLNDGFSGFLIGCLLAAFCIYCAKHRRVEIRHTIRRWSVLDSLGRMTWPLTIVILANLVIVLVVILQGALLPLSSWDALGAWSHIPFRYIQYDAFGEVLDGFSRADGERFPRAHPRHPMTIFNIIAFSGFHMAGTERLAGWLLPWSIAWVCGALVTYGWALSVTQSAVSAGIASYVFCTIPLLENHATHALGYADLWIALFLLCSVGLSSLGLIERDKVLIVAGACLALIPTILKNTGLLVTSPLLLALLVCVFGSSWSSRTLLRMYLLSAVGLFLCASIALEVLVADGTVVTQVAFGGWSFDLLTYPLNLIFQNQVWALLLNGSFSVLGCFFLLALALCTISGPDSDDQLGRCSAFLLTCVIGLIFAFTLPQLIESYAVVYAEPSSDTGNSRFLMGISPLLVLLSVLIFHRKHGEVRLRY